MLKLTGKGKSKVVSVFLLSEHRGLKAY